AQLTRDLFRFIERRRDSAARCSHIEFLQQLFGLIFVDIHSESFQCPNGQSGIARAAQLSNDFSFANWLASTFGVRCVCASLYRPSLLSLKIRQRLAVTLVPP